MYIPDFRTLQRLLGLGGGGGGGSSGGPVGSDAPAIGACDGLSREVGAVVNKRRACISRLRLFLHGVFFPCCAWLIQNRR